MVSEAASGAILGGKQRLGRARLTPSALKDRVPFLSCVASQDGGIHSSERERVQGAQGHSHAVSLGGVRGGGANKRRFMWASADMGTDHSVRSIVGEGWKEC